VAYLKVQGVFLSPAACHSADIIDAQRLMMLPNLHCSVSN